MTIDRGVSTIDHRAVSPANRRPGHAVRVAVWRLLYWFIGRSSIVAFAAGLVRAIALVGGEARAQGLVSAFERRLVFSGWPHHRYGWVNLHVSRFVARVRRWGRDVPRPRVRSVAARTPLRVGCVGRFRGLLGFPKPLFARFPAGAELHLFDLEYNGRYAEYLADVPTSYVAIEAGPGAIVAAARAINADDLDVLINVNPKLDAYDLLDRVDTPCVLNFCAGSDLLHHDRVAVQLHGQPQADYFVVGRRMFCGTTASFFGPSIVYPFRGYFDRRDMAMEQPVPWSARRPLIVFHGSLYKLAHAEVLVCLCRLLADNAAADFAIFGKDSNGALSRIIQAASDHGVSSRVHYEGAFDSSRSGDGVVRDAGWTRLRGLLSEARLAPDPWPVGGASSRFEAFAMGVPSVHMGVRLDPESWGNSQPGVVEVPHLMVRDALAWSSAEYRALCERCLADEAFAERVVEAQLRIARELSDPERLWSQIFAAYAEWLTVMGADTAHVDTVRSAVREP